MAISQKYSYPEIEINPGFNPDIFGWDYVNQKACLYHQVYSLCRNENFIEHIIYNNLFDIEDLVEFLLHLCLKINKTELLERQKFDHENDFEYWAEREQALSEAGLVVLGAIEESGIINILAGAFQK